MRIQDRIYQAFTGSRPNVLGKVLEDISPRKATKPKHKKLSERTMQLIATAASIAILISAGFGGFAYYRDYFAGQKPGGDSTLNGTNPGITQPTTPVCADIETLLESDRNIVSPSPTEKMETSYEIGDGNDGVWYLVTIHYQGYTYLFKHADGGNLLEIEIPLCDCTKEGYISETVAQQIAYLYVSANHGCVIDGSKLITPEAGTPYYRINLSGEILQWADDYYVNAVTGELENWRRPEGDPSSQPVPEEDLIAVAKSIVDPDISEDALSATTEWYIFPVYNFTHHYCLVTIRHQKYTYHFDFNGNTSTLRNISIIPPQSENYTITKNVAVKIAQMDTCQDHLHDSDQVSSILQSASVSLDITSGIYSVKLHCATSQFYQIDAHSGEIIGVADSSDMISEERAQQIVLEYTNYTADEVTNLICTHKGTNPDYWVEFTADGCEYQVAVSTQMQIQRFIVYGRPAMSDIRMSFGNYDRADNWHNLAIPCIFDTPAQLSLAKLFANGFAKESSALTTQEVAYLQSIWGNAQEPLAAYRLPAEQMDQVLQTCFGITLAGMDAASFDGLVYYKETDCYYLAPGNRGGAKQLTVYRMWTTDDGLLQLCYYTDNVSQRYIMTVRQTDDGWQFLRNQPLEDLTDPEPGEPDVPDGSISFWGAAELAMEYTGLTDLEHVTVTGNRIDDHYVIYLNDTDILYKVTVKAYHSFDILDFEMIPLVEGGIQYKFESMLMDHDGWYNAAIAHQFASLEELQLKELFCTGFPGESTEFTAEELALFPEEEGYYGDLIRLPKDKMDAVLQAYFGTSLSQLDGQCFTGLQYLESTGCYYSCVSDVNRPEEVVIWGAEFIDFELLQVRYRLSYEDGAPFFLLTLRYLPGGSWQIISNVQE